MSPPSQETVTRLLEAVRDGDANALNKLFPLIYDELHALAQKHRQYWHGDYTLNTTALVHEAYLKLADQSQADWTNRVHFFAVAAKAMRHILINYAEHRRAQKRGGKVPKVSLDELNVMLEDKLALTDEHADNLVSLNEALKKLEHISERQSRIVECRFFGGMTVEETAAALDVSTATVKRGWAMARVWLYREMQQASGE
ncbi:MAG: sigma-70 family RNA polymerase sigma factor [Rhodothermales bacterium]